jgi:prepilin-type N-terminal cleavage/methylation domain-containing protein
MKLLKNQTGFSVVEVAVVVVILAILGFAGYTVYSKQRDSKKTSSNTSQDANSAAGQVKSAPDINSTSDLDKAQATLDQTNPDATDSDTAELDTQLSAF